MIRLAFAIELNYEVADNPADFVFNIHAAHTPWQFVFVESVLASQPVYSTVILLFFLAAVPFPTLISIYFSPSFNVTG